jgi:hypothetical protein
MNRLRRGQTIIEYTMIIGIVVVVLTYMGTGIKRGVQSLVKVTADQVGIQNNADQDYNDAQQGYMIASNTSMQENNSKGISETGYISNVTQAPVYVENEYFSESSNTSTNTITNGGFTPTSQ